MKLKFTLLLTAFLMFMITPVISQTSTTTSTVIDTAYKTGTYQYPVITKTITITNTVTNTVIVTLPGRVDTVYKCDSVIVPPVDNSYVINSMYVSPIEDWIASPDMYLAWAKNNGVNELNLYARAYITSSSKHASLAGFIKKAKEQYGIKKVFVDYRLTTELPSWKVYVDKYKGTTSNVDGLITEREPYVTGDYLNFYPFLKDGSTFAKANNLLIAVYMGQPTQQCWDSICYYSDRVYLSLYITMTVWNNSTNGYNYVAGRWGYMANSNTKTGKKDMPVIYILSLEKTSWGAGNNFMGDWFINNPFYGSTWDTLLKRYNENATTAIKSTTELVGSCIFYSKYAKLAKP